MVFSSSTFFQVVGKTWKNPRTWKIRNVQKITPRNYTTLSYNIQPEPRKVGTDAERTEFRLVFQQLVKDLTEPYSSIPEIVKYYTRVLEENMFSENYIAGFLVVPMYKTFCSESNVDETRLANILGLCVNMCLTSVIITDDILDSSTTRCGIPCWHTYPDIGMKAINDASLIGNGLYLILDKYFSKHHCYIPAIKLFHHTLLETIVGQTLGTICNSNGKVRFDLFNKDYYNMLALYKGSIPSFFLPCKLGMYLSGTYDAELEMEVTNILHEICTFGVIQNDILDCYGDTSVYGKPGNDIQNGACTWLVVNATQRATQAQKQTLIDHYGKNNPESEWKIKRLYDEMKLLDAFLKYEEDSFVSICRTIENSSNKLPRDIFVKIVRSIYGRL